MENEENIEVESVEKIIEEKDARVNLTALRNPWFYVSLGFGIILAFVFLRSMGMEEVGSLGELGGGGDYDDFSKCLTENDLKMYGTEWCSYCKKQKALFGSSFEFIDYTDCDAKGGVGYPTWKLNGESYSGVQSLETLGGLTGCEL